MELSLQTHIKVDRSPGQVWVVNFSAQPVEVRVVCEVLPRKSARLASRLNQDRDKEAAESPARD